MPAKDVLDLVAERLDDIRQNLSADDWDRFSRSVAAAIDGLGADPATLDAARNSVRSLMKSFSYTNSLLEDSSAKPPIGRVRGIGSPREMPRTYDIDAIRNRFSIILEDQADSPPDATSDPRSNSGEDANEQRIP